ncbi:cell division protein ZipA [Gammaproteobacteria bacterium 50_400_T64]|nr:cell division protein ZipA [Gammaproteobacteria bacterium 50_400_T64]
MELGGREILIALGALLIVAILLDGFRRVRRAGKGKLRVKRRRQPIFEGDDLDEFGSELPGGGARVVAFRDEDSAEQLSQTIKANREQDASRLTAPFRQVEPTAAGFEENAPLADVPAWAGDDEAEPALQTVAGGESASVIKSDESQISLFEEALAASAQTDDFEEAPFVADGDEPGDSPPAESRKKSRRERGSKNKSSKGRFSKNKSVEASSSSQSKQAGKDDDIIILHLMAEQGEVFQGNDLLEAVVKNGLRYGSLKIFHRHVREDGSGDVLFSMANSVNPGTFELNTMNEFSTPGVTFMMVLADSDDPLGTFDLMLECIHSINTAIGGALKDQQRSALSQQTAEHYRESIMDFNRRRLATSA